MSAPLVFIVGIGAAFAGLAVAAYYKWTQQEGSYYHRYPAAKLWEEMAKGGFDLHAIEHAIKRVGEAPDQHGEAAKVRKEMCIEARE